MNQSKKVTFFVNSGADISVYPSKLAENLPLVDLERPMEVRGFDGDHRFTVTQKVELSLDFSPGSLQASFFVCDTPHPIIGANLLQDESKISL